MKDQHKNRRVTRRRIIQEGARLGTGLVLAPLVLRLTGCADEKRSGPGGTGGQTGGTGGAGSGGQTGLEAGGAGSDAITVADGSQKPRDASVDASKGQDGSTSKTEAGVDSASQAETGAPGKLDVLLGLYQGDAGGAVKSAVGKLDFSWLKSGDSVLIKVASNSGNAHPAVTSPAAVQAMVAELKARGAGRVVVADQAGVEWVRLSAQGRFSSTRERFQSNGLIAVEGDAEVYFFDDQGFDAGYFQATLPSGHHWPRGAWIPNIIKEVDHIVYMPRMGGHQLAGLSLGLKSAIGWLRDDSRHDLHNDAQYFHAKYAEINYADEILSRIRLTVTACDKALLHGGPDTGTVYTLDPSLVVASANLAHHDALVCSIMVTLNKSVASTAGLTAYVAAAAPGYNTFFAAGALVGTGAAGAWVSGSSPSNLVVDSFEQSVTGYAAVARAWELSGGAPGSISILLDGEPLDAVLRDGIQGHGGSLYSFA